MAFTFPSWYVGEFEDMELVVKQVLDKHLVDVAPRPTVTAWLDDNWRDNMPVIAIARAPSALSDRDQLDSGLVHVWCICDSRADSWALSNFVRTVLTAYGKSGGMIGLPDGRKADLRSIVPAETPELSMTDGSLSERVIPMSFHVTTRKPAGTPDYTKLIT